MIDELVLSLSSDNSELIDSQVELSEDEKNLPWEIVFREECTPSSYHRRIQMIKRNKNDHKRTMDDNDDV